MPSPTLLGVIICAAAAVLEGVLVGRGARQRLAQLRMPPYSPPFALWLVIGFLFYAMCFVILRHVLSTGPVSPSRVFALVLMVVLLLSKAFWSVLFFRWCDLRASFIAFVPYAVLVAALVILLARSYPLGAILLSIYYNYLSMLLDGAIIYGDLTPRTPDQAMQRTASQSAFHFVSVCHLQFPCVARATGLAMTPTK